MSASTEILELGDYEFQLRWVALSPAEQSELGERGFARFRKLTAHIEESARRAERAQVKLAAVKPMPTVHVDGAALLDRVRDFLARFVSFPSTVCLDTVTLWVAHAHMILNFHTTPRLALLSPEPESGKTRGLEIIDLLTPNPMLIFSPSPAAIFRKLAQEQSTLLFDESDTIFTTRGKDDQNEDLRALLNAGYRRGAAIPRCVGPHHAVHDFKVFAATALAGIGDLPDTIMGRSIVIRMRRRAATEHIEQFRVRVHEPEGHELRVQLAAWAAAVGPAAGAAWPPLPEGVVDRRAEQWEPLIALADQAGADWPDRARKAAVTFVSDVSLSMGVSASLGVRLLGDLRTVFGDHEEMFTKAILEALTSLEEAPWGDLHGKALNDRGLANRLKRYGIYSRQIRIGERTAKGYRRHDLHDSWARYLPPHHPHGKETRETNVTACQRCNGEGCPWCEVTA